MKWISLILAILVLGGCSLAPNVGLGWSADQLNALSKDDATICVRTRVIYGVGNGEVTVYRTKIANGTVQCDSDGMKVKSGTGGTP